MGHEIPNNQTIFQFKCVVENFLRDNKDNGNVNFPSVTQCCLWEGQCSLGDWCSHLTFMHSMDFFSSTWCLNVEAMQSVEVEEFMLAEK